MVQLFICHSDSYLKFLIQGIIGTGTCVLSKVPIVDAVFHEFSMNGYPHQVQPKRLLENALSIDVNFHLRFCMATGSLVKVLGSLRSTSKD